MGFYGSGLSELEAHLSALLRSPEFILARLKKSHSRNEVIMEVAIIQLDFILGALNTS